MIAASPQLRYVVRPAESGAYYVIDLETNRLVYGTFRASGAHRQCDRMNSSAQHPDQAQLRARP